MEYLSPPTTPKRQKLGCSGSKTPPGSLVSPSPDRYIPNRAHIDFDYCNSKLSPNKPQVENEPDGSRRKVPPMEQYVATAMLGGSGTGKRMIEVFEKPAEYELILEKPFKVCMLPPIN